MNLEAELKKVVRCAGGSDAILEAGHKENQYGNNVLLGRIG